MLSSNTIGTGQIGIPGKRVLLIRNAAPYDFGGAERFVVQLAEQLGQNGWDVVVVTAHRRIRSFAREHQVRVIPGWWCRAQNWSGARVLLTPVYLAWQTLLIIWYLQLIWRLQPDVVHPQSKDDFIAATIAARLAGKRVVWTDHADLKYIYQQVTVPFKNPIGKLVRWASRFASAITLVSQSEQRLIKAELAGALPSTYSVVYNGVVDNVPSHDKLPTRNKNSIVFCSTSRLVTAKGIGELISAFALIAPNKPYELWLVGDGPNEATLKTLAGKTKGITFWGYRANPLDFVAAADIFVHPSYHEGFSLSLVEAAMLTKPIIACNVGGNPEIITDGKNGLLIPSKDQQALAEAMERIANNHNLRDRLGRAARQTYERSFRFDTIVKEKFIPLYETKSKN